MSGGCSLSSTSWYLKDKDQTRIVGSLLPCVEDGRTLHSQRVVFYLDELQTSVEKMAVVLGNEFTIVKENRTPGAESQTIYNHVVALNIPKLYDLEGSLVVGSEIGFAFANKEEKKKPC